MKESELSVTRARVRALQRAGTRPAPTHPIGWHPYGAGEWRTARTLSAVGLIGVVMNTTTYRITDSGEAWLKKHTQQGGKDAG